jgi:hypothetical protein
MCKRPLILSTLYPALSKANCTVVREKLIKYTSTGILSLDESGKERTREFDALILRTGFNITQYLEHVKVVGRDGLFFRRNGGITRRLFMVLVSGTYAFFVPVYAREFG